MDDEAEITIHPNALPAAFDDLLSTLMQTIRDRVLLKAQSAQLVGELMTAKRKEVELEAIIRQQADRIRELEGDDTFVPSEDDLQLEFNSSGN